MLKIKNFKVGRMQSNCYFVIDTQKENTFIIDAGDDANYLIKQIDILGLKPLLLIASHGHFDHNMAAYELQSAYNIPYFISEKDLFLLKKMPVSAKYYLNIDSTIIPKSISFLKKGKRYEIEKSYFEVMEIPGHTPGGIALYNPFEKILISGDVIFKDGSIGRYDFSYSSKKDLDASFKKIFSLPEETIIYPGHGDETSIIKEKYYHS